MFVAVEWCECCTATVLQKTKQATASSKPLVSDWYAPLDNFVVSDNDINSGTDSDTGNVCLRVHSH